MPERKQKIKVSDLAQPRVPVTPVKDQKRYIECKLFDVTSVNEEERTIDVVMTTTAKDRDGDIVETSGLVTDFFEQNPAVFGFHNTRAPAIGSVVRLRKMRKKMEGRVKFAETPLGNEMFRLYADGHMKAWSIGFMPLEFEPIREKVSEDDDRERITGFKFTKAELLELSAVGVGSNREALSKSLDMFKDEETRKQLIDMLEKNTTEIEVEVVDDEDEDECKDMRVVFGKESIQFLTVEGQPFPEDKKFTIEPVSAFKKSMQERGEKGKIPVRVVLGKEVSVEFGITQILGSEEDGVVKEAKVNEVVITIPSFKHLVAPEEGRDDDTANKDTEPGDHSMELEIAEAELGMSEIQRRMLELL